MKIYTRRGDAGETGLFGGGRVPKSDPRVEAFGAVDELNAAIGSAMSQAASAETRARLKTVQADLFAIGAHLATPPPAPGRRAPELPELPDGGPARMEAWIDQDIAVAGPLRSFVLPSGSAGASQLHLARAVCRRAERRVVALAAAGDFVPAAVLRYVNRLSDYLFAAARLENHLNGKGDVAWTSGK